MLRLSHVVSLSWHRNLGIVRKQQTVVVCDNMLESVHISLNVHIYIPQTIVKASVYLCVPTTSSRVY